jgi:hypothetical protein
MTDRFTRLLVALLVGATLALPGCATIRATGDAIDKIVTGDEDPLVKAKRALIVAYDTHANASRAARMLYASGDISREQAESAHHGLSQAKRGLDQARLLLALGDLTQGMDAMRRAETIIRAVMAALPKEKA